MSLVKCFERRAIDLRLALAETLLATGDARKALQSACDALDRSEQPECHMLGGRRTVSTFAVSPIYGFASASATDMLKKRAVVTNRFSGLRSRWTISLWWAVASPRASHGDVSNAIRATLYF
jgi:hypothetical protein